MRARRRILAAAVAAVAATALAGCTAGPSVPTRTATPMAAAATGRPPGHSITVLDAADPVVRAVEASRTLFASSPGVVVAPAGNAAALLRAAADAGRLGVPLLLVPAAAGAALTAVRTEVGRLHATWIAPVGAVRASALPGARRVDATRQAPPPHLAAPRSVALVEDDAADAAGAATARAADATIVDLAPGDCDLTRSTKAVAALSAAPHAPAVLLGAGFASAPSPAWTVASARSGFQLVGGGQRPLPGHRFVALYGVPGVPVLGALGDQGVDASIRRVKSLAAEYAPLSDEPVVPALEIIATVAAGAPGDDHDYSNELDADSLRPWVDAARRAGVEVLLDLQPGRADFPSQATRYASLLEQPNVGLALDPEWRLGPHQVPLKQIGSVSAAEVNRTSAWLAGLVAAHHLPPKLFVLHQFRLSMLQDRDGIVQRPELSTVIHVDGQGGQPDKQATWRAVHDDAPASIGWGWKNFLHKDHPTLTPQQTMLDVRPTPDLITYQ
jgi:hypothetical protein